MTRPPDAMMVRTLVIVNLVGGTIALAAASVTDTWAPLTLPTRDAYILGLFVVNGVHGVMHLAVGLLGLLVWWGKLAASRYFIGHTSWFVLLSLWGITTAPGWSPTHTLLGVAINLPDHIAHLGLATISLSPLLNRRPWSGRV
jgi:hypothetical protein